MSTAKSYLEAVGKRKSAKARARLLLDSLKSARPQLSVNQLPLERYFPTVEYQKAVKSPIELAKLKNFNITVKVKGGGPSGQAQAIALALAKLLVLSDKDRRQPFKKAGLLRRDSRIKERRKFGLKKARKAPQWSKR